MGVAGAATFGANKNIFTSLRRPHAIREISHKKCLVAKWKSGGRGEGGECGVECEYVACYTAQIAFVVATSIKSKQVAHKMENVRVL